MTPSMHITADEINCLVYAYLQDSGFQHSSFALRTEGRLDLSPHAKTPIRRGELVDLLSKALLYTEVEAHWKLDSNAAKCVAPFSLLVPHTCSARPARRQNSPVSISASPRPELFTPHVNGTAHEHGVGHKRKASPKIIHDNRAEKRARTAIEVDENIRVDENTLASKQISSSHVAPPDPDDKMDSNNDPPVREINSGPAFVSLVKSPEILQVDEIVSPVTLLQGHDAEVFSAAWNPARPNLLASGSKDATVRIWSWDNVKGHIRKHPPSDSPFLSAPESRFSRPIPLVLRHQPKSDQPDITSLDWNLDGTLLATGSYDRLLRIWRVTGEPYMTQIHHSGPIFSVQFSATGKWLLSASLDGTASVWDVATKKLAMQYKIHTTGCLDVDWLDDSTFVSCSIDHVVYLVSLSSCEAIRTFVGHENEVNQVKFNKHRTLLASCSDDHNAQIWSSDSWTNPDGTVASQKGPGVAKEQPAMKCLPKFVLRGHENSVGAVRWCPAENGAAETLLATCSFDTTARLWDASKGTCLRVFTENTKPLFSITFSPEGKFVATGSEDGYLYIYNASTGNKVWRWPATGGGAGPIYDVNWQKTGGHRLAMCMKAKVVAVVETDKIPELNVSPVSSQ